MFHTYVTAKSGRQIDLDRALWIADRALFDECHANFLRGYMPDGFCPERLEHVGYPRDKVAQTIWDKYCMAHEVKYGEAFEPNVSLTWDA